MSTQPHAGWYFLALDDEIAEDVTPLRIGRHALVAVRDGDEIRVFDGTCPHRGAHLGYGGKLAGGCIICPFHGKRIALGDATRRWSVPEHRVLRAGVAVFVRLGGAPEDDRGFEQTIKEIAASYQVVGAVREQIAVPVEYVVENAFDAEHFQPVHLVPRVSVIEVGSGEHGELRIEIEFRSSAPPWEKQRGRPDFVSRFLARAFSPTLVVTELGSHVVITGAVPNDEGCVARVALGMMPEHAGGLGELIDGSKFAFQQDRTVWDHLDPDAPQRYDARDEPVIAFGRFCADFTMLEAR